MPVDCMLIGNCAEALDEGPGSGGGDPGSSTGRAGAGGPGVGLTAQLGHASLATRDHGGAGIPLGFRGGGLGSVGGNPGLLDAGPDEGSAGADMQAGHVRAILDSGVFGPQALLRRARPELRPDAPAFEPEGLDHGSMDNTGQGEQCGASNILEPGRSEMRCVLEGQGTGDCLFQLTPITDEAFKKVVFLPVTIIALERVVPLRLDEVVALDFYTDGTGGGVDPSALHGPDSPGPPAGAAGRTVLLKPAWAAAVVARHRDGSRALLGAAGGLVADFLGEASKGNGAGTSYSAEEIAILWATVWLLASLGAGDWSTVARFTFHTDSMPARDVAVGAAGAKGSRNSGTILRDAYRALQEALHGDVRLEYVPSHVGHPWNELVDRLAAAAGCGAWPSAPPRPGPAQLREH